MNNFEDYRSYKDEHIELIDELLEIKSKIISRFTHVLAICEYISALNEDELSDDLINIFDVAFEYLSRQIDTIETIYKKDYRNNLEAFNGASRTINLLLHIDDFLKEYETLDNFNEEGKEELSKLYDDVLEEAEKGKDIDDIYFGILNDLVYKLFPQDYRSINDILYDIAIELDLVDSFDPEEEIDPIFGVREKIEE